MKLLRIDQDNFCFHALWTTQRRQSTSNKELNICLLKGFCHKTEVEPVTLSVGPAWQDRIYWARCLGVVNIENSRGHLDVMADRGRLGAGRAHRGLGLRRNIHTMAWAPLFQWDVSNLYPRIWGGDIFRKQHIQFWVGGSITQECEKLKLRNTRLAIETSPFPLPPPDGPPNVGLMQHQFDQLMFDL